MTQTAPNPVATKTRRMIVPALILAVLANSLLQTMIVPALPVLQQQLGVDAVAGSWVLTAYLLSGAVASPVLGSFGDRFGHRRILLGALVVFTLGAIASACAPNFTVLLVGRVLQGASTVALPLSLALVGRAVAPERRASAVGWLSGTFGLGAGIALVLGGVLIQYTPWAVLFWVGAGVGIAAIVAIWLWVPAEHVQPDTTSPVDLAGVCLFATFLISVLLVVSQVGLWGWGSLLTWSVILIAVASLVALVIVENRAPQPLLDFAALARGPILLANVIAIFLGFVPYLLYVGVPYLLLLASPEGPALDSQTAGLVLFPTALAVFIGGRIAPVLRTRMSAPALATLAMGLMAAGAIGMALVPASLVVMMVFYCLLSFGNGIGFSVVNEIIATRAPAAEVGSLLGVNGVIRTAGSAFGGPVAGLILATTAGIAGFTALFWVTAAAAVFSVVAVIVLSRRVK